MGQLEHQRLVEVRNLNSEQQADRSNKEEWWKLPGNQHRQKASKQLCSYSAICKKLQLLTKNESSVDKELLWIWQASNQTLISRIQVVNRSVKSWRKRRFYHCAGRGIHCDTQRATSSTENQGKVKENRKKKEKTFQQEQTSPKNTETKTNKPLGKQLLLICSKHRAGFNLLLLSVVKMAKQLSKSEKHSHSFI